MIAALGDIHGNLPALEAVLTAIDELGVEEIWCHGDICYGGPWPKPCAELIQSEANIVTSGNTDDLILAEEQEILLHIPGEGGRRIIEVARRDREAIGERVCAWLRTLPAEHQQGAGEDTLILTHATRISNYAAIPADDASDESWLEAFGPPPATVVCGHNHRAFEKRIAADLVVINTGSVGAPSDGDWRPSFLLIDQKAGIRTFSHRRVEYDREPVATAFEALGHREGMRFAQMIRSGNPGA